MTSFTFFFSKNLLTHCEQEEEEERLHDRISLEKHVDIRGHSHDLRLNLHEVPDFLDDVDHRVVTQRQVELLGTSSLGGASIHLRNFKSPFRQFAARTLRLLLDCC